MSIVPDIFPYRNPCQVILGEIFTVAHMGGCQNYGPLLDPQYNTAPNM